MSRRHRRRNNHTGRRHAISHDEYQRIVAHRDDRRRKRATRHSQGGTRR